jgi:hypothetical protein
MADMILQPDAVKGKRACRGLTTAVQAIVMPGLVPGIHVLDSFHVKDVDGRDHGRAEATPFFERLWASGSDAVLRTAMPGHDDIRRSR